jgi:hypothetical protein
VDGLLDRAHEPQRQPVDQRAVVLAEPLQLHLDEMADCRLQLRPLGEVVQPALHRGLK